MKGATLVNRKRFRFAKQRESFSDRERQRLRRSSLSKGLRGNGAPVWEEFASYGQACFPMARETPSLLHKTGGRPALRESGTCAFPEMSARCSLNQKEGRPDVSTQSTNYCSGLTQGCSGLLRESAHTSKSSARRSIADNRSSCLN